MALSACAAQTVGNLPGSAAIWALAGDESLHALDCFYAPDCPGFGGRQAFSKGHDQFYSAMTAVADHSFLLVRRNGRIERPDQSMPNDTLSAFPVVVVEGRLYEAYFGGKENDLRLEPRNGTRCHWRGAASWKFHATIDVVTRDHLEEFRKARAHESELLLTRLHDAVPNIEECSNKRTPKPLIVFPGPRGMVGLPALLVDLGMLDGLKAARPRRKPKALTKKAKSR